MPVIGPQLDIYPENLLESVIKQSAFDQTGLHLRDWWCIYTRSRQDKKLARQLADWKIPYFCPLINRRYRARNGRVRTVVTPLFPNYLFLFATDSERYQSLTVNAVSRITLINKGDELASDLYQIQLAVRANVPLTPEARLTAGQPVRVRTGPFRGYEGVVLRREGKTRLLLAVRFLEQGVSMEIDEALLEPKV